MPGHPASVVIALPGQASTVMSFETAKTLRKPMPKRLVGANLYRSRNSLLW